MALSGLANDPAIVQHSAPLSYPITYGHPSFSALCGLPTLQQYAGQTGFPHISAFFPGSHVTGSRSATSTQKRSLTVDAGVQVSGILTNESNRDSKTDPNDKVQPKGKQLENVEPLRRNSSTRRQPIRQRGNQRRGRGPIRNINSNRNQKMLKFENDYDFEQANAEFLELETKLAKTKIDDSENIDANSSDVESFYDRQKSFFDNISCEASQRNARFDWRQERKLNVETFGVPRSNTWVRRRRGRGAFRGRTGFMSRPLSRDGVTQKTVKFEDDIEKPVEITAENSSEVVVKENEIPTIELTEIPTIELVVEKDKDTWEGQPGDKGDWK